MLRSRRKGAAGQARCRTPGAGVQEQVTKSGLMSRSRCLFSGAGEKEQEARRLGAGGFEQEIGMASKTKYQAPSMGKRLCDATNCNKL